MKINFVKTLALCAVLITAISCKDKTADSNTTDAKEVAETTATSMEFEVDTAASVIEWKGSKPLGSHNGTIAIESGSFAVSGTSVDAGKFRIDMNSITDLDLEGESKGNLEAHLKGTVEGKEGDFFNVNEFPYSMFVITGVSENDGKSTVSGNLTIRDKTNNIEFPATVSFDNDQMELKSETFTIDRTKWGVNFGSKSVFDNLGDKFIDDEIELTVSVVAKRQ